MDPLWIRSDRLAKDVTDCATILEVIASHDKKDSTSLERTDCDFTSALVKDVKGMKIGIPKDYFGERPGSGSKRSSSGSSKSAGGRRSHCGRI